MFCKHYQVLLNAIGNRDDDEMRIHPSSALTFRHNCYQKSPEITFEENIQAKKAVQITEETKSLFLSSPIETNQSFIKSDRQELSL